MSSPPSILLGLALIATCAAATPLHADESGDFVDVAILQPESRAVLEPTGLQSFGWRSMTYSQIIKRDRTRRKEKPLVDFAFAFSRAVAGSDHNNLSGGFISRKPNKVAAFMQHQDLVIAELKARETQITDDLEVEAPLSEASNRDPAHSGRVESVPIDFRKALKAVPASRTSGWSGMTLAFQGVSLRFVDEGGAAPVQYR